MGAPSFEGQSGQIAAPQSQGVVDFIVHKLRAEKLTYRQVALRSGMSKSRVHRALHPDRCRRQPLRVDEMQVVLDVLGISSIEATIASEIISDTKIDAEGTDKLIELVTGIVSGLHVGLAEIVQHVDGLEWDDVRSYHGKHFQKRILEEVHKAYCDLSARRDMRTEDA